MNTIIIGEDVLDRLRDRDPRFHESAYLFVLASLSHVMSGLDQPRHISGAELAEGVRDLSVDRFGPMARTVLEHWGIGRTTDVGEIVFALVDLGVLVKQDHDVMDDFSDVYDFDEAFEKDYPWGPARS